MAHDEQERRQFGAQLAQARSQAGFTMEAAAIELTKRGYPVVKQTIGAWEKGRNLPDALWLKRLARLYETTADALLGVSQDVVWPFRNISRETVTALDDLRELERGVSLEPTEADVQSARESHVRVKKPATKRRAA